MGGFFGVTSKSDCMVDVFFGTDYHSHLGTRRAGMAAYDEKIGLQREIHNIENSPFRTKFENILNEMKGKAAIGCISDTDPQPLLIRSHLGTFALCMVAKINNLDELIEKHLSESGGHFDAMTGGKINSTELVAAMISQKSDFVEGIRYVQDMIDGTCSILILKEDGNLIAARDKMGRLPILVGKGEDGYCVSFESFAYSKLDYADEYELGPAEIIELSPDKITQLAAPGQEMRICAFLWSYYGYPTSRYEGVNVETMRYRNGKIMAANEMEAGTMPKLDYVCGIPDSGTPPPMGYAAKSKIDVPGPFSQYTTTSSSSFTPANQKERNKVAKMKQIPVHELIEGKDLLFVDDSIVRGTQLGETVEFLYENGAKSVHMRSACPPIMYGCKYLNFSTSRSDMELLARRVIQDLEGDEGQKYIDEYSDSNTERGKALRKVIAEQFNFDSLEFQTLEGVIEAIGLEPCKLCTYCWNGKE